MCSLITTINMFSSAAGSEGNRLSRLSRLQPFHLDLLKSNNERRGEEIENAPVFTADALGTVSATEPSSLISQYGFLAGISEVLEYRTTLHPSTRDPQVFFNVASPSSTFICGSQGSSKSHTLSCILENCLIRSEANKLPRLFTGLVFHYDTFILDFGGSFCEAAYLSSDRSIKVQVLCSSTNFRTIQVRTLMSQSNKVKITVDQQTYCYLNINIKCLQIDQDDLNIRQMLNLMSVNYKDGLTPLYIYTISHILCKIRIVQQEAGTRFDYTGFKDRINKAGLTPSQRLPLDQYLETLESFIFRSQTTLPTQNAKSLKQKGKVQTKGTG